MFRTIGGGVRGFGLGKRYVMVVSGWSESVSDLGVRCPDFGAEFSTVGGTGAESESVVSDSSDGDAERSRRIGGSCGDQDDGDESGESKGSGESGIVRLGSELLSESRLTRLVEELSEQVES